MEIELNTSNKSTAAGLLALVLLIIFAVIGRGVTAYAEDGAPLFYSYTDFQIDRAEAAYQAEVAQLDRLQRQLSDLLAADPNPASAQIIIENLARTLNALDATGQATLQPRRDQLRTAAVQVLNWSVGLVSIEDAKAAVGETAADSPNE